MILLYLKNLFSTVPPVSITFRKPEHFSETVNHDTNTEKNF